VAIIESLGIPYQTFDILSDESIRTAAKDFSAWPTFPQIYLKGEFIGGNDILTEMHGAGELQEIATGSGA
jgi:monothiol glutaredoxin